MVFQNNVLSGAAGSGTTTYAIDQSIRFDAASDALMYSPTPSSGKSFTTTATISMWVKLGKVDGTHYLAGAYYGTGARYDLLMLDSSNRLRADGRSGGASASTGTGVTKWTTTQVFRDPSAWYHLVLVYDTTNAVQSERFRLYVNGARVTDFATAPSYGASELVYWFGKSSYSVLGSFWNTTGYADSFYWDGYIAEAHGIDGTALDQDSFGEYNSSGIWVPKEYTGSHGTDGFYIKGADASDLGINSAANGNDFTLTNIASHDQVSDSPTNSFCVLNPIMNMTYQYLTPDVRDVNLASQSVSASLNNYAIGSMGVKSGKWYFEARYPTLPALSGTRVGFISLENASSNIGGNSYGKEKVVLLSNRHTSGAFSNFEWGNGSSYPNTSATSQTPFVQDDIIGVAFDCDNSTIQFYKNGSTFGSQFDYSAQSNAVDTSDGDTYAPIVMGDNTNYTNKVVLNFGQDSTFNGGTTAGGNSDGNGRGNFKYSVPSGYLALCTANLGS